MKKNLILTFSILLLIVTSCKKTISESEEAVKTCQITELNSTTSLGQGYKSIFSSNKDGNITSESSQGNDYSTKTTYEYLNSKILETYTEEYNGGTHIDITNYILDGSNRIVEDNRLDGIPATYVYNQDGYLIKKTIAANGNDTEQAEIFSYTNGNLTKVVSKDSYLIISYSNELQKNDVGIDIRQTAYFIQNVPLLKFFGKQSTNLPSKIVKFYNYNGSSVTESYTYTKDANNNILSVKTTLSDTSPISTDSFSYSCN